MSVFTGKIIKGIGGFYYVYVEQRGIYECRAKGSFRKQGLKPLVGDDVQVECLNEEERLGNVTALLPRSKVLVRPAVANVDQALVVFAAAEPSPNWNLLDRFLLSMHQQEVPTVICLNKTDIVLDGQVQELEQAYRQIGYRVYPVSVREEQGLSKVRECLRDKTTVLAGPSGVGKSSLLNYLLGQTVMQTGQVSEKIKRGRHTTRHSEIFCMEPGTYIMDTPGFSSLYVNQYDREEIREYFSEFAQYERDCRFLGCMHLQEPGCAVKQAVEQGNISRIRYENYKQMLDEVQQLRRW